jgi:hypothetical protein
MISDRHSKWRSPIEKKLPPIIKVVVQTATLKQLKKKKEIENRYSFSTRSNTSRGLKSRNDELVTDVCKTSTPSKTKTKVQNGTTKVRESFLVIELQQQIEELKNEFEIKESHRLLEISVLKTKLDEQTRIYGANKRISDFESKTIDLLCKKIDAHLESISDRAESWDMNLGFDINTANESKSENKTKASYEMKDIHHARELSTILSESALSDNSKTGASPSEFEWKYSQLKNKIDQLINANKHLQTQFKVKQKRDSSLERKMSIVDDKITKEVVLPIPNHRNTRNRTNYLSKEDPYQISINIPKIPKRMFSFYNFYSRCGISRYSNKRRSKRHIFS